MRVSELAAETKPFEAKVGEHVITGTYRPDAMTLDFLDAFEQFQAGGSGKRASEVMAETLTLLVASWELEGDDGKPWPITPRRSASCRRAR